MILKGYFGEGKGKGQFCWYTGCNGHFPVAIKMVPIKHPILPSHLETKSGEPLFVCICEHAC